MSAEAGRWLSFHRRVADAKIRLFCFPFGGGGASTFSSWPRSMPVAVEVFPIQPPGRENRLAEPPITSMPQMIDALVEVLSSWLDRPFALFGHSVGAMIAFELARRLRRQGLRPEWLFVSGHPSPDLPRRRPLVSHLGRAAFINELRDQFDLAPALLADKEMMDLVYPVLRGDYELVETYRYGEESSVDVPLTVFGGLRDPETSEVELLAWRHHTTGPFRVSMFEGDHMFINTSREALIREVAHDLLKTNSLQALTRMT